MIGRWHKTEKVRRKPQALRACLGLEALEERTLLNAGSLDLTFGIGGKSISQGIGTAFDGAQQADGKIVAVGGLNGNFVLARYSATGVPDSSFGTNGVVTTDLGSAEDQAEGVVIQPDGKIVVAGFTKSANNGRDFAVVRYNPNGTLDASFGTGGVVKTDFSGFNDVAGDVLLQPDGKIVLLGTANVNATDSDFALARYNPDGTLDGGFGTGGKVTTNVGQFDQGNRGVLQSDWKIILVGGSGFNVIRYNTNGSLDASFGTGGKVLILGESIAQDVALRTDGKILVGGTLTSGLGNTSMQVAQFFPDGTLDTSYATGGVVTTFFPGADAFGLALAIQNDGSVLLGGSISPNRTLADDWALVRYTVTGSPDFSFGLNGKVITDMGSDLEDIHSLLVTASGSVVAVGLTGFSFGLARYQADPPKPIDITPNALYVDQVFQQLLGRQVDDGARNAFTAFLNEGSGSRFLPPDVRQRVARSQLVQIVQSSLEYRTNVVQNLYQGILNRAADANGLAAWVSFLGYGGTQQIVFAELMGSAEYVNNHGGTPSGFVTGVYNAILGRNPDSAGGNAWVNMLNQGASTQSVVLSVLRSTEAATFTTSDLFAQFLNREPDAAGAQFFINAIGSGVTNEYLVLFIVASQEFYDNSGGI